MGASWGKFKSEPMLKLWTSYRLADTITGATASMVSPFSARAKSLSHPWKPMPCPPPFASAWIVSGTRQGGQTKTPAGG